MDADNNLVLDVMLAVDIITTERKISTAEKPSRESLIHQLEWKKMAAITPVKINNSHINQQARERADVLRMS